MLPLRGRAAAVCWGGAMQSTADWTPGNVRCAAGYWRMCSNFK